MKIIFEFTITIILGLSLVLVSCKSGPDRFYHPPEHINDGLDVGSLAEVDIDSTLLKKALRRISRGKYNEVHSMLIFKDNKLVIEAYFPGYKYQWDAPDHHGEWVEWDKGMPHIIMSATKSITSTCIGIAIDKGFIESVHQSIFDYLPEHQNLNTNGKDKITIEHLLTMTSGLEWNEWDVLLSSLDNDLISLNFDCEDPIRCILEHPLVSAPGTSFTYSGGNMILLGEIIKHATNLPIDEFSREYLFEPLGIASSNWSERYENGVIYAGGGINITPRDMVKIGATFLNDGIFNEKRIVSNQWIEKCTTQYSNNINIDIPGHASGSHGYSYSWWLKSYPRPGNEIKMYSALGWGGQEIMVLPQLNTVVVFTGGNYTATVKVFDILEKYILPSIN
ncbi:MAG: serine hydrolase [Saprospiraceae bacterium]|nr:MAG: serine hydrolase [Saprospiraceae bacterium]